MFFKNHGRKKKRYPGLYLVCSAARNGTKKCHQPAWNYVRFESIILTALHREVDWKGLLPRTKESAQDTIEALEERRSSLEVERQGVKERIARVVKALEEGATGSEALTTRLEELEARAKELGQEVATVSERLQHEQERLRAARESVQEIREAFAAFMVDGHAKNKEARERLASVLRDVIQVMKLSETPKAGRVVEVELRGPVASKAATVLRIPFEILDKLEATAQRKTAKALRIGG
jgi:chromosome segregation ATPase